MRTYPFTLMTYYDSIADGYSELHGEEQQKKARIILGRLKPGRNESLLDVGCGDASYLDMFGCECVGVDPSEELLEKYEGIHQVLPAVAEDLPFEDSEFDIVISITAIQNFTDPEKGLREIERVCKDRFALSYLKRSPKAPALEKLIRDLFKVDEIVEEDKDLIFFCTKRDESKNSP
ncbi:class I SAM-dependent methyltransferase [Candidatus Woesearchaeota archaeon]|nr:class I SAM-dependent methyltransferase [Candidatus Woesearchaeota archaeon]